MDEFVSRAPNSAVDSDSTIPRNELRDSLFLIATLRVAGAREFRQVRVRNLSAGGLMAEVPSPIPQDLPVELELRGIGIVNGKIAWNAAGRVGIAFDEQIDPKAARKPVGASAKTPIYVKSVLSAR